MARPADGEQPDALSQLTEGVVQPVISVDLMRRCAVKLISRKPPNVHADVRDVVAAGAARYAPHIQQVCRPLKRAPEARQCCFVPKIRRSMILHPQVIQILSRGQQREIFDCAGRPTGYVCTNCSTTARVPLRRR